MVSLKSSQSSPANRGFNAALCLLSLQFFHFSGEKKGSFLLWSLKAQGSYPVSYPALPPIQHFDRRGLVCIQTPPLWMCQRNGVLETMAWQFSKVRVKGRQPQLPGLKSMSVWHWKQPLERPERHPSCLLPKGLLTNVAHGAWWLPASLPGPWVLGLKRYAQLACPSTALSGYAQGMCRAGGRQAWPWKQPWEYP